MTQITAIEGLVGNIQSFSLQSLQLSSRITLLEQELAELPEVIRINNEIAELRKLKRESDGQELTLREQGKQILLDSGMKEFTTLDGTTVALQFTPGSLVIGEGATIPEGYMRIKTTEEVDKTLIKKAIADGIDFGPDIYIQKEAKLIIKKR